MKKIIFLDIDGVLNSAIYTNKYIETNGNIDESRLVLLKDLIDRTGAEIVLSSTWRRHWDNDASLCDEYGSEITEKFGKYKISILDKTPWINVDKRKLEIKTWLDEHQGDIEAFVILDDLFFGWEELSDHVVNTNYRIGLGLEEAHIERAYKILMENK